MIAPTRLDPETWVLELGSRREESRLTAVWLLTAEGGRSMPALQEAVERGGARVAGHALAALVLMGDPVSADRVRSPRYREAVGRPSPSPEILPSFGSRLLACALYRVTPELRKYALRLSARAAGAPAAAALRGAILFGDDLAGLEAGESDGIEAIAVQVLLRLVTYSGCSVWTQCKAAEALGEVGDAELVPALCWAARDQEQVVRDSLVEALARIGPSAVGRLAEALHWDPTAAPTRVAEQALIRIGEAAVPGLVGELSWSQPEQARRIVEVLGAVRHPSALPHLVPLTSGGTTMIRREAVIAVAAIGGPDAVAALWEALSSPLPYVRCPAAVGLHQEGARGSELVPALVEALVDHEERVSSRAMVALATLAREQPSPALREALPVLQRLASRWSAGSRDFRRACGATHAAIEAATGSFKDLPLPASPADLAVPELPIPSCDRRSSQ